MRFIFKTAILVTLLFTSLMANIDECKTDLYYANGIMMPDSEEKALMKWRKKAYDLLFSKPETYKKISDIKISYNISESFLADISESFEQIENNEWGWETFTAYYETFLAIKHLHLDWDLHDLDLSNQVEAYKKSIKHGHGVTVLAHSQGNYYTNEAYELLDEWMKVYFKMFGIATPANHVAGYIAGDTTAPYVKFHNDFIGIVPGGLPSNRHDSHHHGFPSVAAHDFYKSYLSDEGSMNEIMKFVEEKINAHSKAPSQWETDEEFDIDTKNYKITVKHRFDPSVSALIWEKVFPFQASKKLYQLKTGEYVKASCGGKRISETDEYWMIDNPEEEKIRGEANKNYRELFVEYYSERFIDTTIPMTWDFTYFYTFNNQKYTLDTIDGHASGDRECSGHVYDNSYIHLGQRLIGSTLFRPMFDEEENMKNAIVTSINEYPRIGEIFYLFNSTIKCILEKDKKALGDISGIEHQGYTDLKKNSNNTTYILKKYSLFRIYYK